MRVVSMARLVGWSVVVCGVHMLITIFTVLILSTSNRDDCAENK